jgi:N,N-dimethylformamidase
VTALQVHFHEDDLTDCEWRTSLELPLPDDLRSGVYALKLVQPGLEVGEQWIDYVPVFVQPAQPKAKLAFLMPTVSFQCYEHMAEICPANTRHADGSGSFGGTGWPTVTATGALLHQLPSERCLGRSTYDHHNDGDGVKYASTLRPSLQTRPLVVDANESVWQFPAEAHILAFLDAKGIDYDVLTDHQLHAEGADALRPYTAVLTSTHPEYYSKRMLDAVMKWTQHEGGRLVSLGANGFYWHVAFPP